MQKVLRLRLVGAGSEGRRGRWLAYDRQNPARLLPPPSARARFLVGPAHAEWSPFAAAIRRTGIELHDRVPGVEQQAPAARLHGGFF